jgi:hypothetical protein
VLSQAEITAGDAFLSLTQRMSLLTNIRLLAIYKEYIGAFPNLPAKLDELSDTAIQAITDADLKARAQMKAKQLSAAISKADRVGSGEEKKDGTNTGTVWSRAENRNALYTYALYTLYDVETEGIVRASFIVGQMAQPVTPVIGYLPTRWFEGVDGIVYWV